jgi:purine-binding chemotaxis protein CheW
MMSSYLIFLLSGRLCGVRLSGAIEILPWRKSRPVPLAYTYVEGLIDYRGTLYPVFNLAQRLGMSRSGTIGFIAEEKDSQRAGQSIILLEENKTSFGIIVDSVAKMATLADPVTAPEKIQDLDPTYVKGIVHEDDQDIMILDFERLLHAD